jgi:MFS family permease
VGKLAMASLVGTTIEWYDFQLYGMAAAVAFDKLFFPNLSQLAGTLASFAIFSVGFIARPLGGLLFGHFGDRIGRRSTLLVALLLTGISTFLVGVLPTYASVGAAAPIALVVLRVLGGIGLGGEWGGAVLLSVEHAPPNRRGLYGSFPQIGSPAGFLLATAVFAIVTQLPDDQFLSWGWRVPFLLSAVLVVLGLFIRTQIAEPPALARAQERVRASRLPLVEVVRTHPKQVLLSIGAFLVTSGGYYVYATYMVSYGTDQLQLSATTMLIGGIVFSVGGLIGSLVFSAWSDRVGRRPVFIVAAAFTALYAFPLFWLVELQSAPIVWLAQGLGGLANGALYGLMGALTAEMFDPRVRYTGASIGQQVSAAAVGGTTPLIVTALVAEAGSYWPAPAWLAALSLISLLCVYMSRETGKDRSVDAAISSPAASPAPAGEPS